MQLLGATALYAFAVRLALSLVPRAPLGRAALLALLGAATLWLPDGLAPVCIAAGWLLTFVFERRVGWAAFSLGVALLGRTALPEALWRTATDQPSSAFSIGLIALTLVAARGVHPAVGSGRGRRGTDARTRARALLLLAARRYTPRGIDDGWRMRAADAVDRATAALKRADRRSSAKSATDTLAATVCGALELLVDGDPRAAADCLAATARTGPRSVAGAGAARSEPMRDWAEVAAWCELAARLIASGEDAL